MITKNIFLQNLFMKKLKQAFTLLEIMVVIALIWLIIIWATNLSFNSLSDTQRLNGFFYKIKTNIETVKNNVLIWREINNSWSTIISDKWQIDFNNSSKWSIRTYYYDDSNIKKLYSGYDIIPEDHYEIVISNDWSKLSDLETVWILINWRNLTLTWITTRNKTLDIEAIYKGRIKKFTINTISWVIEEKK